jgi:vacuolar-type H+-ATPase subunit I/STV1
LITRSFLFFVASLLFSLTAPKLTRISNARYGGLIGLAGGLALSWTFLYNRFAGMLPNEKLAAKYGVMDKAALEAKILRMRDPTITLIDNPDVVNKK